MRNLPHALLVGILLANAALAQDGGAQQPRSSDEIAISPSRMEVELAPGTEKTVVLNIVYSSANASAAKPSRLIASLGDWGLSDSGQVQFFKPGEKASSASKWILYSPAEFTAMPGKTSQIRVTISVPKDAKPGDYHTVIFVEERPGNLKTQGNKKELTFHFRLSSIIYVMVPPLERKPSLKGLKAEALPRGIAITPTIANEGNSHVRPSQSFQVIDAKGGVVADFTQAEGFPILRESTVSAPLMLDTKLGPGEYQVRYRVDFHDGSTVKEGRTKLTVGSGSLSTGVVVNSGHDAGVQQTIDAGVSVPDAGTAAKKTSKKK